MICSGINAETELPVTIEFGETIESINSVVDDIDDDLYLTAGFVDIQVNGFLGIDFNNPRVTVNEVHCAVNAMVETGVTRCLPTVITGAPADMLSCLRTLTKAKRTHDAIAGFHVEGPHIGVEDGPRGAHPARWVRPPDLEEYKRWQEATDGDIRIVTLSPHWPEAPRYIGDVVSDGVTVSIGHTGASADQIRAAVDAGATMSTHLGNGAHAVMRRHPNYIWDQLAEDRLTASFIVDGIHLGEAYLRVALRAKGVKNSVLVTDAAAPAGAAPGRYRLGEQDVDLVAGEPEDKVVLAGTDKLAGSALKMHRGIANLVRLGGLTLRDALLLATVNPAKAIRLRGRQKGLAVGDLSDIVSFRYQEGAIRIEAVYVGGKQAWPGLPLQ